MALLAPVAFGQGRARRRDPGPSAFDTRSQERAAAPALANPARAVARAQLGDAIGGKAIVELDNLTGTPRFLGRLDGYLTAPSSSSASAVVLGYLRDHLSAIGLRESDLAHLRLADDYADSFGVRHLTWQQEFHGIVAFDNFVRASVTRDGRLINIVGSPLPSLAVRSLAPKQSAQAALGASLRDVGGSGLPLSATKVGADAARSTEFAGGHTARLVLFGDASGPRLAWLVMAKASSTAYYVELRDANDASLLYRANLVKYATGTGKAWRYYPGAASGGTRGNVVFPVYNGSKLFNSRTHTWSDLNDDDVAQASEEVPANSGTSWNPSFTTSFPSHDQAGCSPSFPCTWNSSIASSWAANRAQNAQQVFWYVNNFHDWLARPQIGFTSASHNFETTDPVLAQADDGANTAGGFPDDFHIANANMNTLPDGTSPIMQMYLFVGGDLGLGTPDANGGDDASVVYHEYTHGLSNRLITDGTGLGALNSFQSGSMGEAWSDWYAMDYLVRFGYEPDSQSVQGQVVVGRYLTHNGGIRTEPLDCVPGDTAGGRCPGTLGAGSGGYTYGDLGKVIGSPEVHADGEIWGQLLWQLRDVLIRRWGGSIGSDNAEKIITGAMRLSPPEPSMLDMRNALIMADHVYNGETDQRRMVSVVTNRGMGYFASTTGGTTHGRTRAWAVAREREQDRERPRCAQGHGHECPDRRCDRVPRRSHGRLRHPLDDDERERPVHADRALPRPHVPRGRGSHRL